MTVCKPPTYTKWHKERERVCTPPDSLPVYGGIKGYEWRIDGICLGSFAKIPAQAVTCMYGNHGNRTIRTSHLFYSTVCSKLKMSIFVHERDEVWHGEIGIQKRREVMILQRKFEAGHKMIWMYARWWGWWGWWMVTLMILTHIIHVQHV